MLLSDPSYQPKQSTADTYSVTSTTITMEVCIIRMDSLEDWDPQKVEVPFWLRERKFDTTSNVYGFLRRVVDSNPRSDGVSFDKITVQTRIPVRKVIDGIAARPEVSWRSVHTFDVHRQDGRWKARFTVREMCCTVEYNYCTTMNCSNRSRCPSEVCGFYNNSSDLKPQSYEIIRRRDKRPLSILSYRATLYTL